MPSFEFGDTNYSRLSSEVQSALKIIASPEDTTLMQYGFALAALVKENHTFKNGGVESNASDLQTQFEEFKNYLTPIEDCKNPADVDRFVKRLTGVLNNSDRNSNIHFSELISDALISFLQRKAAEIKSNLEPSTQRSNQERSGSEYGSISSQEITTAVAAANTVEDFISFLEGKQPELTFTLTYKRSSGNVEAAAYTVSNQIQVLDELRRKCAQAELRNDQNKIVSVISDEVPAYARGLFQKQFLQNTEITSDESLRDGVKRATFALASTVRSFFSGNSRS